MRRRDERREECEGEKNERRKRESGEEYDEGGLRKRE